MLPDVQPLTIAFTVPAQQCGSKAKETKMGATVFIQNCEGRIQTKLFIRKMCAQLVEYSPKIAIVSGSILVTVDSFLK